MPHIWNPVNVLVCSKLKKPSKHINKLNIDLNKSTEYCYEIEALKVNSNYISFLLYPYEENKISNIFINNI